MSDLALQHTDGRGLTLLGRSGKPGRQSARRPGPELRGGGAGDRRRQDRHELQGRAALRTRPGGKEDESEGGRAEPLAIGGQVEPAGELVAIELPELQGAGRRPRDVPSCMG